MMTLPTLYSRDNTGKIKQWKVEVAQLQTGLAILSVTFGQFGTNNPQTKETKIEGKNIGRSNETTPYEQACNEAKSKWETQRSRKGYYSVEDLGFTERPMITTKTLYERDGGYFTIQQVLAELPAAGETYEDYSLPMKAQNFWKESKVHGVIPNIQFPCIGQSKLNGVRCTLSLYQNRIQLMSHKGVEYTVSRHITDEFWKVKELFSNFINDDKVIHDIVLDGELYCHGMPLNEIVSAVRTRSLISATIKFAAFDLSISGIQQADRLRLLKKWFENASYILNKPIQTAYYLPGKVIRSVEEAVEYGNIQIENGFEGAIFRSFNGEYIPGKRVNTMVKYKKRKSQEFEIIDVIDSRDNPGMAIFVCLNDINQETFKVNPEGTFQVKRNYFANKARLIGKKLTVEFYDRTTDRKVPFHTIGIAVRDYE